MAAFDDGDNKSKFDTTLDSLNVVRALLNECIYSSKMAYTVTGDMSHINDWTAILRQLYKELDPKLKEDERSALIDMRQKIDNHEQVSEYVNKNGTRKLRIYKDKYMALYNKCEQYEISIRRHLTKKGMLISDQDDPRWAMG